MNIANILSRVFTSGGVQKSTAIRSVSSNPFANPFVAAEGGNPFANYAKNTPMRGGYFAGYYNGKPNIVGQRLFVEV